MLTNTEVRKSILAAYVELYVIDATRIGGTQHRLTPGTAVSFGGLTYSSFPIKMTGIERAGDGKPTRPQLSIDNITKLLHAEIIGMGDMVGAEVTRIRTFAKYLDDGATPNSAACTQEKYYINQKLSHTPSAISFELVDALELSAGQLPNIQATNRIFPAIGRMGY